MSVLLAAVGDLHIGSTVGLCPRRVELDDGGTYEPSKSQRWLLECWQDYWQQVAARKRKKTRVVVLLNGDLADRNRHSKYQLVTINRAVIQRMMLDILEPVLEIADAIIVVRGTEAHVGGSSEMEEWLAADIDAIRDEHYGTASWWCWEAALEGVNVVAAHHPGTNSGRPWTRGGGANRAAAIVMDNYYGETWQPDLAIFNHVHHNEDSYDNHPVRAIFNRSFSLRTAYDHRSGRSLQASVIGGLIAELKDGEIVGEIEKPHYKLPRRAPWKLT